MLPNIFHVGQLVSCIVLRVDDDKREGSGNKRIWLSLRLSLLYKGLTLDAVQDGMVHYGHLVKHELLKNFLFLLIHQ